MSTFDNVGHLEDVHRLLKLDNYLLRKRYTSSGESRIIFLPERSSICQYPPKISAINRKKQSRARLLLAHPVFVVAENNSVGHSQHSSLMPCMTEPIVLRKQRSGKPGFWDVNYWEIYDKFVRHIRERAKLLMQQNVLPRSLSTNNLLYLCEYNHATVNNFDERSSDSSVETEM